MPEDSSLRHLAPALQRRRRFAQAIGLGILTACLLSLPTLAITILIGQIWPGPFRLVLDIVAAMCISIPMGVMVVVTMLDLGKNHQQILLHRLALIANHTDNAVILTDQHGKIEWINPGFTRMTGYTLDEVINQKPGDLLQGDASDPKVIEYMRQQLDQQQGFQVEIINYTKQRRPFWVAIEVQPLLDNQGKVTHFMAIESDITARREHEQQINDAKARLEELIKNLTSGVLVEDEHRRIVLANPQFCRMFELPLSAEQLVGIDCSQSAEQTAELFADPPQFIQRIDQLLTDRQLQTNEKLALKNGRYFERDFIPITLDRQYRGHLWLYRDISDAMAVARQQQRLEQLKETTARIIESFMAGDDLNASVDQMLQDIGQSLDVSRCCLFRYRQTGATTDICNTHEWCSPAVSPQQNDLQNLTVEELRPLHDRLTRERIINICDLDTEPDIKQCFNRLRPHQPISALLVFPITIQDRFTGFMALEQTDGARSWLDEVITLLQMMINSYERAVERRIADQQQRAQSDELQMALDRAEQATAYKSRFLANMSHELRTPINAIVGYTELMQESEIDPQQLQRFAARIGISATHLTALINNVLDMAKIEAGCMTSNLQPTHLITLIEEVQLLTAPLADEKQLDYQLRLTTAIPDPVITDPLQLKQILINLIANAIKYTDRGRVEVVIQLNTEPTPQLQFDVIDTGCGISAAQLDTLFQPFTQIHQQTGAHSNGTGLGLDIAKKLTDMLDGKLAVDSTPGRGSRFTLTLPIRTDNTQQMIQPQLQAPTPSPQPQAPQSLDCLAQHILIVDDNPDNRQILEFMLKRIHATTHCCENGRQAVAYLQQHPERCNLILMDMQMPEMDGFEATRQIRAMAIDLPVIALTAYAMTDDRKRCLDAGCNDYLAKPITPPRLFETIQPYLTTQPATERQHHHPTGQNARSIRSTIASSPDFDLLLGKFYDRLQQTIPTLATAVDLQDTATISQIAHRIAGTAANYGFAQIGNTAGECEQAISQHQPHQTLAAKLLEQLQAIDISHHRAE